MKVKNKIGLYFGLMIAMLLPSCGMQKGFDALEEYNYFEAKNQFEKSLKKKDKSPAAYGLSVIYFRQDNPFHNIDSAYHYSLLSVECYDQVKHKKHLKWGEKYGYSFGVAKEQRQKITAVGFEKAQKENTPEAFQYFLSNYPWSDKKQIAEHYRDSIAFSNAKDVGTSLAYQLYMRKYSDSPWFEEALGLYFRAQFDETVVPGEVESYETFIETYYDNPFVRDAEFQIYTLETEKGTIEEYQHFIEKHKNSPFINDAWKYLYRLSISDYQAESIVDFQKQYPNFPFPELIEKDLSLVGKHLLQFVQHGQYGFMDVEGNEKVPPQFIVAGKYHNGLAVVSDGKKYGYINKEGKLVIDYQFDEAFDFDQGRAVVEIDDLMGLIDVSGQFILEPKYEDIGSFSDGLAYVETEDGYQYFTLEGEVAFSTVFKDAFTFKNGLAHVQTQTEDGYIGKDGSFVFMVSSGKAKRFSDSLFIHEMRDSACLVNPYQDLRKCYNRIGSLKENRALVELDRKYGYIDEKGEEVIAIELEPFPNYFQFAQFENNHAITKRLGKTGMIDKNGKSILPAIFQSIETYGELIPITKGEGWGYTDESVMLIIPYEYDYAGAFVDEKAIVQQGDFYGVIDTKGKEITEIIYDDILRFGNQFLRIQKESKYGLITLDGEEVLPIIYNRIIDQKDGFYQLILDDEMEYYNVAEEKIIALKKKDG